MRCNFLFNACYSMFCIYNCVKLNFSNPFKLHTDVDIYFFLLHVCCFLLIGLYSIYQGFDFEFDMYISCVVYRMKMGLQLPLAVLRETIRLIKLEFHEFESNPSDNITENLLRQDKIIETYVTRYFIIIDFQIKSTVSPVQRNKGLNPRAYSKSAEDNYSI